MKLTNHTNNNYKPKQLKLPFVVQKNVLIKLKIQINLIIKKLDLSQNFNLNLIFLLDFFYILFYILIVAKNGIPKFITQNTFEKVLLCFFYFCSFFCLFFEFGNFKLDYVFFNFFDFLCRQLHRIIKPMLSQILRRPCNAVFVQKAQINCRFKFRRIEIDVIFNTNNDLPIALDNPSCDFFGVVFD